jgi:hypothetical protein
VKKLTAGFFVGHQGRSDAFKLTLVRLGALAKKSLPVGGSLQLHIQQTR